MQPDLDIERRRDQRLRPTHLGERIGLINREPPGAGKVQQEQVILHEISAECRLRQIALSEA